MTGPKKSLGQHWLKDRSVLASIVQLADVAENETVLEIGPGLGTLTAELLRRAGNVIAVEYDAELARKLPGQFPGKNLTIIEKDILKFNLNDMPSGYKVVANVPYYITGKILQLLLSSENKPTVAVLLVQKEVAERLAAAPGDMSLLAVSAQIHADVSLGPVVPAEQFTPPPKVDSQAVVLQIRDVPLVPSEQEKIFFRVVKAGFSAKRKKLRSSLAAGLAIDKKSTEDLLTAADINPDNRAEDLTIAAWLRLVNLLQSR